MQGFTVTGEVSEGQNPTRTRKVLILPAENSITHVPLLLKSYVFSSRVDFTDYTTTFQYQMTSQHPYFCRCFAYEARYQENVFEVVLERLPRSLPIRFSAESHCPWEQAELRDILEGLVDALADAQRLNIAHRQICVDHLYCTEGNSLKLGNFAPQVRSLEEVLEIARGQEIKYRSPELRRLLDGDRSAELSYNPFKSDVYSLGITFLLVMHWGSPAISAYLETSSLEVLDSVKGFPSLYSLLSLMISPDERNRPDFLTLKMAGNAGIPRIQEGDKESILCSFCHKIITNKNFRVDNKLFCDENCVRSHLNSGLKTQVQNVQNTTGILHYKAAAPWTEIDRSQVEREKSEILQENLKREKEEIARKMDSVELSPRNPGFQGSESGFTQSQGTKRQKLLVSKVTSEQNEDKTCKKCGKGLKLESEVSLRLCKPCELNREPKESGQSFKQMTEPKQVSDPPKLCKTCREPLSQGYRSDTCKKCTPNVPPIFQNKPSDSKPKESQDPSVRKPVENRFPNAVFEAPATSPRQIPKAVDKSTKIFRQNPSRPMTEAEKPSIVAQMPDPQSVPRPDATEKCLICKNLFEIPAVPESWRATMNQEFPTQRKLVDSVCSNDCMHRAMEHSPIQGFPVQRRPPEPKDPNVAQPFSQEGNPSAQVTCIVCFQRFLPKPVQKPDFEADVQSFCSEKCMLDYINQQEEAALELTADETTVRCMSCAKVVRSSPEKLPCSPDSHQFCSLSCAKEFLDNTIGPGNDLHFAVCPSCAVPIPIEVSQKWREVQRLVPDPDQDRWATGPDMGQGRFPRMREE